MTSEYAYKLNPHRKLRKQKGIKGMRRTLFNTHVPSTIDPGGGYSDLGWVRMCGPEFQLLPHSKT